jgi:hypothetical protein
MSGRFRYVIAAMLILATVSVAARAEWSAWGSPRGGDANLEYRWHGGGLCLATGCGKDVQFRNLGKTALRFDYTVWAKDMLDPSNEVKQSGTTSVNGEQIINVSIQNGADITRVVVQMLK